MVVEKPITPSCDPRGVRVREVECLGIGSVEWLLKIGHSLVCPVRLSG